MTVISTAGTSPGRGAVLSSELLARCSQRAPGYDRENTFCHEDFFDLREAGYLTLAVPADMGGAGATMAELMHETRRLAYHAPATALAVNMHHYGWVWPRTSADSVTLRSSGSSSGRRPATSSRRTRGTGNDMPVLLSTALAERVDGGYRFHGRKNFGSLSPVWDWLVLHAMDTSDRGAQGLYTLFSRARAKAIASSVRWDTLGMRATRSDDTVLEGAFRAGFATSPSRSRRAAGMDPSFCRSCRALPARNVVLRPRNEHPRCHRRELERQDVDCGCGGMVRHPEVQRGSRGNRDGARSARSYLESVVRDWDAGADHGRWVGDQDREREAPFGRGGLADRGSRARLSGASACSRSRSSSGCFEMRAPAAFIRPTACLRTSSSES